MRMRALHAVAIVALAAGCSDETEPGDAASTSGAATSCKVGFLGDPALAPELRLTARGASGVSVDLDDGGTIPIITPPQGGRVLFVGVRVTNVNACGVKLAGSVRDAVTGEERLDARTVNLDVGDDGWGTSRDTNIGTFANIPVCPNLWSSNDLYDQPIALTLTVTDREKRVATTTITVTPTCSEGEPLLAECLCICAKGYELGATCP